MRDTSETDRVAGQRLVIGRSYIEPYLPKSMRYLIPALHNLGAALGRGSRFAEDSPLEQSGFELPVPIAPKF